MLYEVRNFKIVQTLILPENTAIFYLFQKNNLLGYLKIFLKSASGDKSDSSDKSDSDDSSDSDDDNSEEREQVEMLDMKDYFNPDTKQIDRSGFLQHVEEYNPGIILICMCNSSWSDIHNILEQSGFLAMKRIKRELQLLKNKACKKIVYG